jgi:hypothetical protein
MTHEHDEETLAFLKKIGQITDAPKSTAKTTKEEE